MRLGLTIATFLSFAVSALSIQILRPNTKEGWTTDGPQPLTWTSNANDPVNFTVVLWNNDNSFFAGSNYQILAALVVANQSPDNATQTTPVKPPSGGWPVGDGFTIQLAQNTTELNNISAKSQEFSIKAPNVTGTATSTRPFTAPSQSFSVPTPTDDGNLQGNTPNAASALNLQSTLVPIFALLTFSLVYA